MLNSLIGLVILILDIYAIYLVVIGGGTGVYKLLWILIILCLPLLGMLLYFLLGRKTA